MTVKTKTTFIADPDECEGSPAFHSQPDNEWRIEYHGDSDNEWTVWRWDYPHDEWVPVAITVLEGYPLPESVTRSKGFSDLETAQEWVRSRIAVQAAVTAVSGVLDEARGNLDECDLLSAGVGRSDTDFGDAVREWQKATSRLLALCDAAALTGEVE